MASIRRVEAEDSEAISSDTDTDYTSSESERNNNDYRPSYIAKNCKSTMTSDNEERNDTNNNNNGNENGKRNISFITNHYCYDQRICE